MMIFRDVVFESETVQQRSLPHCSLAHHAAIPTDAAKSESAPENYFKRDFFNGIGANPTFGSLLLVRCSAGTR